MAGTRTQINHTVPPKAELGILPAESCRAGDAARRICRQSQANHVVSPADKHLPSVLHTANRIHRPGNCRLKIQRASITRHLSFMPKSDEEIPERLVAARFNGRGQQLRLHQPLAFTELILEE